MQENLYNIKEKERLARHIPPEPYKKGQNLELLESLERLFLAGKEMEAKDFVNTSKIAKKQREILEDWEKQGYLEQLEKGKKKFYRLGEASTHILQKEPRRWISLQKKRAKLETQEMKIFLEIIRDKSGKALTAAQRNSNFYQIEACLQSNKIEQVGANKYLLTAKGTSFLLALRPAEEILAQLQQTIDAMCEEVKQAQVAHRDLIEEFSLEQPDFQDFLQRHFGYAQTHLQYATNEFDVIKKRVEIVHIASREKREILEDVEKIKNDFRETLEKTRKNITRRQDEWFNIHALSLQEEKKRREEQIQKLLEKQETLINLYQSVRLFLTEQELQMSEKAFVPPKDTLQQHEELEKIESEPSMPEETTVVTSSMPLDPIKHPSSTWADDPKQEEIEATEEAEVSDNFLVLEEHPSMDLRQGAEFREADYPAREYEFEEELVYETEMETSVDVQQVVYRTAREMLQQTVSIPLPELFDRVKMKITMSETEFEHVIRLLHPVLQLETADPEIYEGGLWILGNYCYYVVGV